MSQTDRHMGENNEHVDSDIDVVDANNFKGIYFGDKTEKFTDPLTGAHFEYTDFCQRLVKLKEYRRKIDKRLGLPTSSQTSPKAAKDDAAE